MTLYSVLVANQPLPTIDCTGIKEITVKESSEEIELHHPEHLVAEEYIRVVLEA